MFEPVLTYDVYHKLPFGTTFSWMKQTDYYAYQVKEKKAYLKANNHSGTPVDMLKWTGSHFDLSEKEIEILGAFDTFKRDLCYMQMQQAAKKLGSSAYFSFILVDDRGDILKQLKQFFVAHTGLVPMTCRIQYMQHTSYNPLFNLEFISFSDTSWTEGCGVVNANFEANMRRIRALALQDLGAYEKMYAAHLAQLSATYKVERASDDDASFPPSNKQALTPFAMQFIQHAGPPLGLLAAFSLLVFGGDKQRMFAGASGVLFASVWIKNCFFAEGCETQAKTDVPHTKSL